MPRLLNMGLQKILPIIIVSIGIFFLVPVISAESTEIPSWVKGVANFWVEGNIDDTEFGEAVSFLIEQKIIKVEMPHQTNSPELEKKISTLESENLKLKNESTELKRKITTLESENLKLKNELKSPQKSDSTIKSESGFSAVVCKKDYSGYVQLTGKYTSPKNYSFLTIEFGILSANGDVLDTGIAIISNINAGETKIFSAQSSYKGDFHSCEVQISSGL